MDKRSVSVRIRGEMQEVVWERVKHMLDWKDVTDTFKEPSRHWKG